MSQEEIRDRAEQLQKVQVADPEKWTQDQESALQLLVALDLQIQWQSRKEIAQATSGRVAT